MTGSTVACEAETFQSLTAPSLVDLNSDEVGALRITVPSQLAVREAIQASVEALPDMLKEAFEERSLPQDAGTAMMMELEVHRIFARAADLYFHSIVTAVHRGEAFVDSVLTNSLSARHISSEGTRPVGVTFLGGTTLPVRTPYILKRDRRRNGKRKKRRGAEGNGCYPVLRQLGMLDLVSAALVSEIGLAVAHASYEEAHRNIQRRGVDLDFKKVKDLALALGAKGLQYRERLLKEAEAGKRWKPVLRGKRVVISTDGGRIKCRKPGRGRRRPNGRRGYKTFWREPKLVAIYVVDDAGKKIKEEILSIQGTLNDADEAFRILTGYLKLYGANEARELIAVADGAPWIWNRIPNLIRDIGIDDSKVTEVVDFYHATERLGEIAKKRASWNEKKRDKWQKRVSKILRRGDIDSVLAECNELCRGCRAKDISDLLDYFERNRQRMRYSYFAKRKIPLGSGVIESAIRRIINLRLKGPGIIWLEKNAERVMHLRAQAKAGVWNEFVSAALAFYPDEEAHQCYRLD